jgi:hypothetical protein
MKRSGKEFIEALVQTFPTLCEEIDEWEGLLHVQMGAFARFTQQAIDQRDFNTLDQCFALAQRLFNDADPELENAFYVSYLENLDLETPNGQLAYNLHFALLKLNFGIDAVIANNPPNLLILHRIKILDIAI